MSGIKDKYSIDAKKLYPFLSKCYFIVSPFHWCFHLGKHLGFRLFSLNSRIILKYSRLRLEYFNIILEFNEKSLNPRCFPRWKHQ